MKTTGMLTIMVVTFCLVNGAIAGWTTSGNNMYSDVSGNVGIGTTSPGEKLSVADTMTTETRGGVRWPPEPVSLDCVVRGDLDWTLSPLPFDVRAPDGAGKSKGQLGSCRYGNLDYRIIGVYGESTDTSGAIIGYGGYFVAEGEEGVGVYAKGGPNGCAGKFDGNVVVSVLQITGGSDVSEQFEVRTTAPGDEPAPGMVVSIDPDRPGDLMVSSKAYDRKVAGIISGAGGVKPGMLMGQKGTRADGRNPVALTGRVYCWADASHGEIEPGDLLTTSDTAGHAMKVAEYNKAQGAILGKAMSSLKSGRGLVLVLVTLQ